MTERDIYWMTHAIDISKQASRDGAYPAAAIIVQEDQCIGTGLADSKRTHDPTDHAEIAAIRDATKRLGNRNLATCTLYSTLAPCMMCVSASFWAYIPKILYAIKKNTVSPKWYEQNDHDMYPIYTSFRRNIEFIHLARCQKDALQVLDDWEAIYRPTQYT